MKARSFDLVDHKLMEADYFFEKFSGAVAPDETNYNFSAFVSAARSVTWSLQAVMKHIPDFEQWYFLEQEKMKLNDLSKVFLGIRNEMSKTGEWPIQMTWLSKDSSGERLVSHFFEVEGRRYNAVESSFKHMQLLARIVSDCYDKFGTVIDPEQYYTRENLNRLGLSIEDIEESFGFPRGWTSVSPSLANQMEIADSLHDNFFDERLRVLTRDLPVSHVKPLFDKYLK